MLVDKQEHPPCKILLLQQCLALAAVKYHGVNIAATMFSGNLTTVSFWRYNCFQGCSFSHYLALLTCV